MVALRLSNLLELVGATANRSIYRHRVLDTECALGSGPLGDLPHSEIHSAKAAGVIVDDDIDERKLVRFVINRSFWPFTTLRVSSSSAAEDSLALELANRLSTVQKLHLIREGHHPAPRTRVADAISVKEITLGLGTVARQAVLPCTSEIAPVCVEVVDVFVNGSSKRILVHGLDAHRIDLALSPGQVEAVLSHQDALEGLVGQGEKLISQLDGVAARTFEGVKPLWIR